jgi:hypothetical protein
MHTEEKRTNKQGAIHSQITKKFILNGWGKVLGPFIIFLDLFCLRNLYNW